MAQNLTPLEEADRELACAQDEAGAQGYLVRSAEHYTAAGDTDNEAFVKELLTRLPGS